VPFGSLDGITLYEKRNYHRSYGSHHFDSRLWQEVIKQFRRAATGTGKYCFIGTTHFAASIDSLAAG
jgi:hypothetical protein